MAIVVQTAKSRISFTNLWKYCLCAFSSKRSSELSLLSVLPCYMLHYQPGSVIQGCWIAEPLPVLCPVSPSWVCLCEKGREGDSWVINTATWSHPPPEFLSSDHFTQRRPGWHPSLSPSPTSVVDFTWVNNEFAHMWISFSNWILKSIFYIFTKTL